MGDDTLFGWAEIEAYTGFSDPTLKRWQKLYGFPTPVKSVRNGKSISTWTKLEVDSWLKSNDKLVSNQKYLQDKFHPFKKLRPEDRDPNQLEFPGLESKPHLQKGQDASSPFDDKGRNNK